MDERIHRGMCARASRSRFVHVGRRGRLQNGQQKNITSDTHGKSLKTEVDLEDPPPLENQVFSVCALKEAKVNPQAVQSKAELLRRD